MFKGMEHRKKWETAKKLGLCYRCLGKGHLGDSCTWSRESGIDECKDRHHRLLYEEKVAPGSMEGKADTLATEENKSSTYETVQEHAQRSIALHTVPVILKHGERRLHPIWKCDVFKGMEHRKKFETAKKLGYVTAVWRKSTLVTHVLGAERVELTDSRTDTIGYFMRRK